MVDGKLGAWATLNFHLAADTEGEVAGRCALAWIATVLFQAGQSEFSSSLLHANRRIGGQDRHVNLTHNACDTRHVGYTCSQLLRGTEGLADEEDLAGATSVDVEVQIPRSICLIMLPRDVVPDTLEQDIELVNKDGYS